MGVGEDFFVREMRLAGAIYIQDRTGCTFWQTRDSKGCEMQRIIARTLDVFLRGAAVLTALASLPMALFLGIMANDNGNSKTAAVTVAVLAGYLAVVGFVIWIAIRARGRWWRRALVYIVGVVGIVEAVQLIHVRAHDAMPALEVSKEDVAYPRELNPTPTWTINISGDIETGARFEGFEIHYEAVVDRENPANLNETCSRHYNNPEKRPVYPLQHTERVKPDVTNGRYSLHVVVDKFKVGKCKWMATEIGFVNPDLPATSSPLVHPVIEGFQAYHGTPGAEGTQRIDLWCWTVKGQPYPYGCGPFPLYPRPGSLKPQLDAMVPSEARSQVTKVNSHPEKSDFQINFHNYDALVERAGAHP
jgi:hypothetical protein